jgi:hypothetical protein
MFLTLFLDADNDEFHVALHSTPAAAEAAFEALLRCYVLEDGETLPPKDEWDTLSNSLTEELPQLYQIECDGKPGQKISPNDLELTAVLPP